MDFRLLEYFVTVCTELHFTKAAEKLGISQPTLSQQIRLLEQRVGAPLFRRIGKKIFLTEAGCILRRHAANVFHELEQAQAAIDELNGLHRGRLRIGCSGNHLLTTAIMTFHSLYPGIELSVVELATDETRHGLLHHELDLGVVFLPLHDEHLENIPLYKETLELVTGPELSVPQTSEGFVRMEDVVKLPLILLQKKFYVRQMFDRCLEESGFEAKPSIELSTLEALRQMAANGVGAAVLPGSYSKSLEDTRLRQMPIVDPVPEQSVGIVYHRDTYLDQSVQTFIRHLTEHFKKL
ncbi:MAG: LysR family transcriptional regulator [Gorillibacterium sp.]|nr:LysR family transcriptional regulator [Gorillibacterium sp.]